MFQGVAQALGWVTVFKSRWTTGMSLTAGLLLMGMDSGSFERETPVPQHNEAWGEDE
jgi:hypothetical protein